MLQHLGPILSSQAVESLTGEFSKIEIEREKKSVLYKCTHRWRGTPPCVFLCLLKLKKNSLAFSKGRAFTQSFVGISLIKTSSTIFEACSIKAGNKKGFTLGTSYNS